jgi:hypothetical protein
MEGKGLFIYRNKPLPSMIYRNKPLPSIIYRNKPLPSIIYRSKPLPSIIYRSKPLPSIIYSQNEQILHKNYWKYNQSKMYNVTKHKIEENYDGNVVQSKIMDTFLTDYIFNNFYVESVHFDNLIAVHVDFYWFSLNQTRMELMNLLFNNSFWLKYAILSPAWIL